MAMKLDLQIEKLAMMRLRGSATHADGDVDRQVKRVQRIKVMFMEVCERARIATDVLEAKTCFVTFDSEEVGFAADFSLIFCGHAPVAEKSYSLVRG